MTCPLHFACKRVQWGCWNFTTFTSGADCLVFYKVVLVKINHSRNIDIPEISIIWWVTLVVGMCLPIERIKTTSNQGPAVATAEALVAWEMNMKRAVGSWWHGGHGDGKKRQCVNVDRNGHIYCIYSSVNVCICVHADGLCSHVMKFFVVSGSTPSYAQGLCLALYLGISPCRPQGIRWDWTWAGHMQGKHTIPSVLSLSPPFFFYHVVLKQHQTLGGGKALKFKAYLVVLQESYWLCAHEWLLVVLWGRYVVVEIKKTCIFIPVLPLRSQHQTLMLEYIP